MLDLLDCNGKKDIKSMTLEEVTAQMAALGEKSFRAKQLYDWMHVKLAEKFDDMSSLSRELRQKLKENYSLTCLKLVDERVSQVDGTRKYLFGLEDGHVIESVCGCSTTMAIPCAFPPRWAAVWAAVSARPLWTAWNGTCVLQRCWIRYTGSSPSPGNVFPMWWSWGQGSLWITMTMSSAFCVWFPMTRG